MDKEISILKANQTYDLIPKSKKVKPVSCRWVFKLKTRANTVEGEKCRATLAAHLALTLTSLLIHGPSWKSPTSPPCIFPVLSFLHYNRPSLLPMPADIIKGSVSKRHGLIPPLILTDINCKTSLSLSLCVCIYI